MNNFKRGDIVECWDSICDLLRRGEYFAFNDHLETSFPHLVRTFYPDGTAHADIVAYQHCRLARPDLEIDDPVWIFLDSWRPRHFAGWTDDGHIKVWVDGKTSHTIARIGHWVAVAQYSITPPDSDA